MKRRWYRAKDGTYYRNSNCVEGDIESLTPWLWLPWNFVRLRRLEDEWWRVFRKGVDRKPTLEPGDIEIQARPFREAYPNHPGLWQLDELDRP
jgi:hypothetical protein